MRSGIAISTALVVSLALTAACSTKKTPTALARGSGVDHVQGGVQP